jgi:hypothetical protein
MRIDQPFTAREFNPPRAGAGIVTSKRSRHRHVRIRPKYLIVDGGNLAGTGKLD